MVVSFQALRRSKREAAAAIMAFPATAVANYFIDLAARDGDSVNPMKVQKLVYFGHGWHLALTGEPLIEERFEAWRYGPVVPSLYRQLKSWGASPIDGGIKQVQLVRKPGGGLVFKTSIPTLDQEKGPAEEIAYAKQLLAKVWKAYRGYTAVRLSNATHVPGSPWALTWAKDNGGNAVIRDELIIQDFKKRADASAAAVA